MLEGVTLMNLGQTTIEARDASKEEDRLLVTRFLGGDELAFTELVNKYRRQVYAVAWRFTHNHEEADDLTQETFVKAYNNLKTFRGESGFKTWLLRITTNLSINLKKSGRVSKDSGETPDEGTAGDTSAPLDNLIEGEKHKQLYRAIQRLPPKQKETLLLKTFKDMTCEEVAGVMRCSVGTVKANVFNAMKRLREIMNPGAAL